MRTTVLGCNLYDCKAGSVLIFLPSLYSLYPLFPSILLNPKSGKSYLTKHISTRLSSSSLSLRVAVLSLDDLYHRHSALRSLAASSPDNKLFAGRGQPGTHDLELGMECLSALKRINESGKSVKLPVFEKSLHDGQGDRSTETVDIEPPLDVVLFEGWMLGFSSLPSTSLTKLYSAASADPEKWAQENLDYTPPRFLEHKLEDLLDVNERLKAYEEGMWRNVDAFVQLEPVEMGYVWEWRLQVRQLAFNAFALKGSSFATVANPCISIACADAVTTSLSFGNLQQEHNMKAQNGGLGMTDAQVRDFIARYVPTTHHYRQTFH